MYLLKEGADIMEEIFKRMSIRSYEDTPVEDKKIEMLLRAAMAAPSAGNQQPWEFYVVRDRRIIEGLAQCSPYANCARNAPVAIVACYSKKRLRFKAFADVDMSAAVENILLEAVTQDLGAVWLGVAPIRIRMQFVKRLMGLPDEVMPFAIIPVGYAKNIKDPRLKEDRFEPDRIQYR
jgi:nitroreductase